MYFDTEFCVSPGWPWSPDPHLPPPYCLSNVVITINVCCHAWPLLCENETLTRPGLVCVVFGRWTVPVPCIIVSATVRQTEAGDLSACSWGWITPHNGRVTLDSGCVSFFFFLPRIPDWIKIQGLERERLVWSRCLHLAAFTKDFKATWMLMEMPWYCFLNSRPVCPQLLPSWIRLNLVYFEPQQQHIVAIFRAWLY